MSHDAAPDLPELPDRDRPPAGTPDDPARVVARGPEDLVAMVPLLLGFEPSESLTLLGFGRPGSGRSSATSSAGAGPHLRIDLPAVAGRQDARGDARVDGDPEPEEREAIVAAAVEPVVRHGAARVAVVVHSARPVLAAATAARVVEELTDPAGPDLTVIEVLRADGDRWWRLPRPDEPVCPLGDEPGACGGEGVAWDPDGHPFRAAAVLAGQVTRASRSDLAAGLEPDVAAVARVHARLRRWSGTRPGGELERRWARRRVLEALGEAAGEGAGEGRADPDGPVGSARRLDDDEVARLVHQLLDGDVRDAVSSTTSRTTARAATELWTDVLRRAPGVLRAGPAALLALSAWVAGDGALAWCAVDRAEESRPGGHPLASVVADLLAGAVAPSAWVHDGSPFGPGSTMLALPDPPGPAVEG